MITHLEPDILEYEVKWALGSITTNKVSGGDGIPVELFQILKAVKMLYVYLEIARKDKKAFLSNQCKEIEENNRMGKTRDLCKKIRNTKGTFHEKMGSIKDRNGMDLTEAEDIKKRWQEYTEDLYKKELHDPDNHDGVITHLETDILECEVKWALESITTNKAGGDDGIPVELFQILKDDAVKVLHSICQQIWKSQQWPQYWKRSVFIPIPKKSNAKECSNYHTIALISAAAKWLQLCLTLCDPRDSSPPGSPIPGILQARTLEWVAISFSNA